MANHGNYFKLLGTDVVKALVLAIVVAVFAVGFNKFRSAGIPLVANEPYQLFVPCPESEEEAEKATLDDLIKDENVGFPDGAVLVDARSPESFNDGHIPGAVNVPYDELEGVAEDDVARLKGMRQANQFIVYCDGWEEEADPEVRYDHPPSEHLADELQSQGVRNVISMAGGLAEYVKRGGKMTGARE